MATSPIFRYTLIAADKKMLHVRQILTTCAKKRCSPLASKGEIWKNVSKHQNTL